MPYPYITREQVEARISSSALTRVYDDGNTGAQEADAIEQLRQDASSRVCASLPNNADPVAIEASTPHEIIRLSLDGAFVYAVMRHPEAFRVSWKEFWEIWTAELKDLKEGKINLGNEPDPTPEEPPVAATGNFVFVSSPRRGWC